MQQTKNNQEYEWKTSSGRKNKKYGRKESQRRNNRNKSGRTYKKSEQLPDSSKQSNISTNQSSQQIYNGLNFSKLISSFKTDTQNNNAVDDTVYTENIPINIPRIINQHGQSVRNRTSKPNQNVSYDTWEFTYFRHILKLRDIFSKCVIELQIPGVDTRSADFFNIFGKFIRECSSGEISPYIEKLNEKEEKIYLEYIIKRNNF